ncbi:MAG: hydantoinase B/oxoprolinase family protein [Pseudomonadota bacterium]
MRFAVDTGGTFTDLVVEDDEGRAFMFKAPTTPDDPINGVVDSLNVAAEAFGEPLEALLGRGDLFIHGTTRSINAVITGTTAKTAFLTTQGHPDILLLREGGRENVFDYDAPYPDPYIPRALTREIPGRIDRNGAIVTPFDEDAARKAVSELVDRGVEAFGVCFLWSIVNPDHELAMARVLDDAAPGLPYSLSHKVSPTIREYRRASATVIDASLKPLMAGYMNNLEGRLRSAGFPGRVLIVTSQGGVKDCRDIAEAPVHSLNSGPSMAPVAGKIYAALEGDWRTAIVADTGGTTYDVSVVRDGQIPTTQETWIGKPYLGVMTGFPSVDVKSVGAGGGSIASVDEGGLLRVGPESAGADPGPVCYGRGGTYPTVTDACVVMNILDPDYFLGGRYALDAGAARRAIDLHVAQPLGLDVDAAAAAIVDLATQNMVSAIEDLTVRQGIDPRSAVLIGGGGAAGLNSALIAKRLNCRELIVPECGAALSAAGALMSDLTGRCSRILFQSTDRFDERAANAVLEVLRAESEAFAQDAGKAALGHEIVLSVEARYANQAWEIPVVLPFDKFSGADDLEEFKAAFHKAHETFFSFSDEESSIEIISWRAAVRCKLREAPIRLSSIGVESDEGPASRSVYFAGAGRLETPILRLDRMSHEPVQGPAVVETPFTTIVVDPGASVRKTDGDSIIITRSDEASEGARYRDDIDGVQMAILANRMDSVVKKMANALMRTARSGVINLAKDFSCAIVTADHQLLTSADSLPIHVLRGPDMMAEHTARYHDFVRGDAFLNNSPYHGGGHAADHTILVPVVDADGKHRFTVVVKAHQADIGNSQPTTYMGAVKDVYEEGALIFPGVKVQSDYKDREDIVRMCEMRIRVPQQWRGDYIAMIGAARLGEKAMEAIGEEIGWDRLDAFVDRWFGYSEERMAAAIKMMPAGAVKTQSIHDPFPGAPADGVPVKVALRIDPDEAQIEIDLRDNLDNLPFGLNTTESTAESACLIGVFNSLPPTPRNAGSFRRVDIKLREGCVVGIPKHPYSCSIATAGLADHVANAIAAGFAEIGDGYGMAEVGRCSPPSLAVISGADPITGAPYINQIFFASTGGAGASHQDAWLTTIHVGNAGVCAMDSVELDELNFPLMCHERRLAIDTAGPGRFRGAPGFWVNYGPTNTPMDCSYNSDGSVYPAKGVRGGGNGAKAAQFVINSEGVCEPAPIAGTVTLVAGEISRSLCAAGGGYGPAYERPVEAVLKDYEEGWVSAAHADAAYGVIISNDGQVDMEKTRVRRQRMAVAEAHT